MSELFPIAAFLITLTLGRQSVGRGLAAVIWTGGLYGIIRANNPDTFTYFLYDASVLGLYLAQIPNLTKLNWRNVGVRSWTIAILIWPLIYFGLGFTFPQHPLIQLVGLRAAIWFVPFILIGAQISAKDFKDIGITLAALNLVAFVFAVGEYFLGIEVFFPRNEVTQIIYMSKDIAEMTAHRIPATFGTSASYGGYLTASFPVLIARLASRDSALPEKVLMVAGLLAALVGVFLCGSRTPVVGMAFMVIVSGILLRRRLEVLLLMAAMLAVVTNEVLDDERLQRVSTLADTDATLERVGSSTRLGILDVIGDYPFGVGLGGAFGTSIPSFLAMYSIPQVGAENELARIALEQSVVGAFMWIGLVIWIVRKRILEGSNLTLTLLTTFVFYSWVTSVLGVGMFTAIPFTAMLLAYMGMCAASRQAAPDIPQAATRK